MTLKIEIQTDELDRALTRLASAVGDMTPIMRAIGQQLEASTEKNFDSEGARIAAKWRPSRRAQAQGGQTLRDTGRLAASISAGGEGHINEVTKDSIFVGTNVAYAAIHQFGGEIKQAAQSRIQGFRIDRKTGQSRFAGSKGRKKANFEQWTSRGAYTIDMPARPFFGLNAEDERDIAELISKMLDKAMK